MIRFESIELRNFASYETAKLAYALPGRLVLIEGVNHDSDAAASNMSGKSNLATEALLWCLYGSGTKEKGPDGAQLPSVRVEDVIRSTATGCSVAVELTKGEDRYRVERTRRRNGSASLEVRRGKAKKLIKEASLAAMQRVLEDVLGGLSYGTFTQTVLFGQSGRRFTTAKDAERKRVLEELLGLDAYTAARERVKAVRKVAEEEAGELEGEVDRFQILLDAKGEELDRAAEDLTAAKDERRHEDERHVAALAEYEVEKSWLEKAVRQAAASAEDLEGRLLSAQRKIAKLPSSDQIVEAEELEGDLMYGLSRNATRAEAARERLRKFKEVAGGECYVCEQPVPAEHTDRVRAEVEATLARLKAEAVEINKNRKLLKPILDARRERGDAKRNLERIERDLETARREERRRAEELKRLKRPSPVRAIADAEKRIRARLKALKAEAVALKRNLEEADGFLTAAKQRLEDLEFWFEGFGPAGIKALLLDNALPQLNELANRYVGVLTAGEVEIELDTESLSGAERFDVRVSSSGGAGYHLCSGGLRRRVDFAVALALQALQAHRGARCSLYLCDEPFESLDEAGVEAVVELLREFARDNELAVYVITHLTGLRDWFDSVVTVEKRDGVSSIVEAK